MIVSAMSRSMNAEGGRTFGAVPKRLSLLLFVIVALVIACVLPAAASAAITYVGSSTSSGNGGSLTMTAPAGTVGDFLVAQFAYRGGTSGTITDPSGWSLLNRTDQGTNVGQVIYWKIATGSDDATFTYTHSGPKRASGGILRYRGVDTSVASIYALNSGTAATLTANSVTTTAADSQVISFFCIDSKTTLAHPAGITGLYQLPGPNSGPGIMAADETKATVGATTPRTTAGANGTGWVTHTVAVRPDITAPATASVTSPVNGSTYRAATVPASFYGSAADDTGGSGLAANSTIFTLQRSSDNYYWTGFAWQAAVVNLTTTHGGTFGNVSATWTNSATLPSWSSQSDGTYIVQATATDNAGNTFTGSAISFTYDGTAPSVAVSAPTSSATLTGLSTMIDGTASDTTSGVSSVLVSVQRSSDSFYWTGLVWQASAYSIPATYAAGSWSYDWIFEPASQNGSPTYAIAAQAFDAAGNSGASSAVTGVKIDNTAPTVTISAPADGATVATATPLLTYDAGGASTVIVGVDGATVGKVSGENLDSLSDGSHYVTVSGSDAVGNSTIARSDFFVDTTAPVITAPDISAQATGDTTPVTLTATATDAHDGPVAVTYWIGTTQIYSGHAFPLGDTMVTAKAVDAVGNQASTGFKVTVNKIAIAVTADDKQKTYGDPDPALTYKVTGNLLDGDAFSGALARDPGEAVGSYAITQGTLALPAYYDLSFTGATLAIHKIAIEVTADDKQKNYGQADPPLTYKVTSGTLVGGDAFSGALARDPGEAVGNYAITQGSLTLGGNYDLSFHAGTLTIDSAGVIGLTVSFTAADKVYDGGKDAVISAPKIDSGIVGGDDVTVTLASGAKGAFASEGVGTHAVSAAKADFVLSGADAGKYSVGTVGDASATITAVGLTITANSQTKVYGVALTFTGTEFMANGLLANDVVNGVTLTSAGAAATAFPGTYSIVASDAAGTGLGNYAITYIDGTLTVTGGYKASSFVKPLRIKDPRRLHRGTTIRVAFRVRDARGNLVVDAHPKLRVTKMGRTVVGPKTVKYNKVKHLYIYNLKTTKAWKLHTYTVRVGLGAGSTGRKVSFRLIR